MKSGSSSTNGDRGPLPRLASDSGDRAGRTTEVFVKYMLALFTDEARRARMTPGDVAENMQRWDAYTREAVEAGVYLGGEGLEPSAAATTIRFRPEAGTLVTDGPFAETREQLGGYYVLDCRDREEALRWAERLPMTSGAVEVRPVMDYAAAGSRFHENE